MANIAEELNLHGSEEIGAIINEFGKDIPELFDYNMIVITGNKYNREVNGELPTLSFRGINTGIASQTTDLSVVPGVITQCNTQMRYDELLEINYAKGKNAFRATQGKLGLMGFMQDLAKTILFGDSTVNDDEFDGLLTILNTVDGTDERVLDLGGTTAGNQSSIVFVNNSEEGLSVVAQNANLFQVKPWTEKDIELADGTTLPVVSSKITAHLGLTIGHSKSVGAIRNVEDIVAADIDAIQDFVTSLRENNPAVKPDTMIISRSTKLKLDRAFGDKTVVASLPDSAELLGMKLIISDSLTSFEDPIV